MSDIWHSWRDNSLTWIKIFSNGNEVVYDEFALHRTATLDGYGYYDSYTIRFLAVAIPQEAHDLWLHVSEKCPLVKVRQK